MTDYPDITDVILHDIKSRGFEPIVLDLGNSPRNGKMFIKDIKYNNKSIARFTISYLESAAEVSIMCQYNGTCIYDNQFNIVQYGSQVSKALSELTKRINLHKRLVKSRMKDNKG